jgi:hypothetical protein
MLHIESILNPEHTQKQCFPSLITAAALSGPPHFMLQSLTWSCICLYTSISSVQSAFIIGLCFWSPKLRSAVPISRTSLNLLQNLPFFLYVPGHIEHIPIATLVIEQVCLFLSWELLDGREYILSVFIIDMSRIQPSTQLVLNECWYSFSVLL